MKQKLVSAIYCCIMLLLFIEVNNAQQNVQKHTEKLSSISKRTVDNKVREPIFKEAKNTSYEIKGVIGDYIKAIKNNWLIKAPDNNPALLNMFEVRDIKPYKKYLPWSGEFAGKYLTGASMIFRLTNDENLKTYIQNFVNRLVSLQDEDGYLGPYRKNDRLTGWDSVKNGYTWEEWNHGHIIIGLLSWYEIAEDENAFNCACKIGDMMCNKFLSTEMINTTYKNSTEMNQGLIYAMTLLYEKTGRKSYLDLANEIVKEFQLFDRDNLEAGDYVRQALAGKEFYQTPRPRWESLFSLLGIGKLYYITGNADYKTAFQNFWWSIVKTDRHNNGGFSSGEGAMGNPYDPGYIETCCTVAWVAMSVEMLKMTGNSIVADELEMSTLNQVVGYQSSDGLWCTYTTPMDGKRISGAKELLKFQIRPGSEEFNCCTANAPSGFGFISNWALMSDKQGLVLNWYGHSSFQTEVKGTSVTLIQETEYPRDGLIKITVHPKISKKFALKFRIPYWSRNTSVKINGSDVNSVKAGEYLVLNRKWEQGDIITLNMDMSFHYWKGEKQCDGKTSIYRGPLLLVHEESTGENSNITLDANILNNSAKVITDASSEGSQLLISIPNGDKTILLRDYGTAGKNQTEYKSWLNVLNTSIVPFSKNNPGRFWRE
jgi:uncharacterized protein